MNIFDIFRPKGKRTAASVAKERLQIIVSHESARQAPDEDFMQKLQTEIMEVICRYIKIDREKIKVQLENKGDQSILELNVTLGQDIEKAAAEAAVEEEVIS